MLELEDVSHVYGNGTRALDHVTLSIPRGMYGLLGPNGAGKSTLMRTVATLQSPTEGAIRFGEIDVIAEPEKLRRTLGYLPQEGEEQEARLGEAIEIGLFTAEPGRGAFDRKNVIRMERTALRSGKQVLRFVADKRPSHVGVDPYNFYIDRNSGDNVAPVS